MEWKFYLAVLGFFVFTIWIIRDLKQLRDRHGFGLEIKGERVRSGRMLPSWSAMIWGGVAIHAFKNDHVVWGVSLVVAAITGWWIEGIWDNFRRDVVTRLLDGANVPSWLPKMDMFVTAVGYGLLIFYFVNT